MSIFAPEWTVKALAWIGWEEGQPIYHKRISKGIEKAQKKVEERNYEIRKSLLEYDEVMDYQRKTFYGRRHQILSGKGLKPLIQEMITSTINEVCDTMLNKDYVPNCIMEWARSDFDVELKPSDIADSQAAEIERRIKDKAQDNVVNKITISLGEYLEDFDDPKTWNIPGLIKWGMSAFRVSLTPGKIKHLTHEEIQELLVAAASDQVDKKECPQLTEFLAPDFVVNRLSEWARAKFDIKLEIKDQDEVKAEQIKQDLLAQTDMKYKRREIEYPVEFAMSMVYGQQEPNVYAFESLAQWANTKYRTDFTVEQLQQMQPRTLHKQLIELSEGFNNGKLEQEISEKVAGLNGTDLLGWANERFDAQLTEADLSEDQGVTQATLTEIARESLRSELSDLERYVLLQVCDSTWKDHLYTMDHLKSSIWTRSFAEKDPKTEYKREGFKLFDDMLQGIEDRVTDIIFKVRLEAGARTRNVWNISSTAHDEVGQFAMAEQQRAAAQAPQGETKVKQIKLEQPKVGRNDPCPCGSGKKFKKCCGRES